MPVEIHDAVDSAVKFLNSVTGEGMVDSILVDEVEKNFQSNEWVITLSYLLRKAPDEQSTVLPPFKVTRTYKTFRVDLDTGTVNSMKIRELSK